ncbi:hypothetical protein NDI52_33115 [Leptolyngbya sp. PL-A3]|uniref:ribbon-helix-helix domain-containing protein n=1 Tax=Leptolyngbya sp. PL-A3 TaxID=2933911 RepID=UPI00329A7168
MSKDRGKRIFLSLPPGILEALERWAESEGNRPTSLANWIVETAIREAMEAGKIPPPQEDKHPHASTDLQNFLTQLAAGESPDKEQITALAQSLGVDQKILLELRDRLQQGNNSGDA